MTRYLLVQELANLAADEPDLRTALPLGFDPGDPEQVAQILGKVSTLLTEKIQSATPEDLATRLRRRTWSGNRPAPIAPLAHAAAIASLSASTEVRLRPGLHHRLVQGDPVRLHLPDRTISLPAATYPALQHLSEGAPTRVADLPGLDEADALVLTRRLLTEAFLTTQ